MNLFSSKEKPVTRSEIETLYQVPRSFVDFLPIIDYDSDSKTFEFDDGISRAAMFEFRPFDINAKSDEFIKDVYDSIKNAFHSVEHFETSWALQFYSSNERILNFGNELEAKIRELTWAKNLVELPEFTKQWIKMMDEHMENVSRPEGAFTDPRTNKAWRAKRRVVRVVLYRYRDPNKVYTSDPVSELQDFCETILDGFTNLGANVERMDNVDYLRWMTSWLNATGEDRTNIYKQFLADVQDDDVDFSELYDISACSLYDQPKTRGVISEGVWSIGDGHHSVVRISGDTKPNRMGRWTGQATPVKSGDASENAILLDLLPDDVVLNINVVLLNKEENEDIISINARSENHATELKEAWNNDLFFHNVSTLLYVSGDSVENTIENRKIVVRDLRKKSFIVNSITDDTAVYRNFILGLPCALNPDMVKVADPSRLMYEDHIINILPIFGAYAGTGNPLVMGFTAAGEPYSYDPIKDRVNNAHIGMVGISGSGKSAQGVSLLWNMMAVHNPYIHIRDFGDSYRIFGQYAKRHGKNVKHTVISNNSAPALPPLADAAKLFEDEKRYQEIFDKNEESGYDTLYQTPDSNDDDERDLLGELVFASALMTAESGKDSESVTMVNKSILSEALWLAAQYTLDDHRDQTMVTDMVNALKTIQQTGRLPRMDTELPDGNQDLMFSLIASMSQYQEGLLGAICNTPRSNEFTDDEIDINILDINLAGKKGQEKLLDIIVVGDMANQITCFERRKGKGRQSIGFADETHIEDSRRLLATYKRTSIKTWRKLGAWYVGATQELNDGIEEVNIVRAVETLIMLSVEDDREQIEYLNKLRGVSDEQRTLFNQVRNNKPFYTEMAIVSGKHKGSKLRSLLPPHVLAIAQTDDEERTERRRVMKEHNFKTEVEAALYIGDRIAEDRLKSAIEGTKSRY